jgi:hypothetical protein
MIGNSLVIGISGKKGSGKSTVASEIERLAPGQFVEETFAKPLKQAIPILFNWEDRDLNDGVVKATVDERWGVTPRFVLQDMGTDYLRKTFGQDFFVKNLKHRLERDGCPPRVIISDLRFKNEAEMLRYEGAFLWRIERPGLESTDTHPSETDLDDWKDWDFVIQNNASLEHLHDLVYFALTEADAKNRSYARLAGKQPIGATIKRKV